MQTRLDVEGRAEVAATPLGVLTGLLTALTVLSLVGWGLAEVGRLALPLVGLTGLDAQVTIYVSQWRPEWLIAALRGVSALGDLWLVALLVALLGLAGRARERHWRLLWVPALAGAGAFAISVAVKLSTGRSRPAEPYAVVDAAGSAFPSGHALRAIAVYGAIAWVVTATARRPGLRVLTWTVATAVIAAIGFSRIYLGAHWLTDVLAGYGLGAAWLAVVLAVSYARPADVGLAEPRGARRGRP